MSIAAMYKKGNFPPCASYHRKIKVMGYLSSFIPTEIFIVIISGLFFLIIAKFNALKKNELYLLSVHAFNYETQSLNQLT